MDCKPLRVSGTVFSTNSNKKPITRYNQTKQTSDNNILTFNDWLDDLMMEQREQM